MQEFVDMIMKVFQIYIHQWIELLTYNQLVNQVSVIITKNGIEESVENLVIDTKNISCKDLVKIIQTIYNNKPDYFVVYNKNYENTRNKEISKLVLIIKNFKLGF
ncbi:DUF2779 domain-containing protein [Mycoplasmopsis felis]|nr:DUF2779 domain-containing protein [Mycoplasmopsis felis]WAM00675.1 DUF2779 domain-containing protein [Mycoplasmopsis felis]